MQTAYPLFLYIYKCMFPTKFFRIFLLSTTFLLAQKVPVLTLTTEIPRKVSVLNSPFRETNLCFSSDGQTLYFMSDRGGQPWSRVTGTFKGKLRYDGDIWISRKTNGQWQTPECLPFPVNTPYGEDEPIPLGDSLLIYQSWRADWQNTGGPYYKVRISREGYEFLEGVNSGITEFFKQRFQHGNYYATDGAFLTPDGKFFYVANGYEYDGNMDIHVSENKNGTWSLLRKSPISTEGDERSLFITPDGKYLYFASDSYSTFGGLDIFVAEIDADGSPSNIKNVGEPINSSADEYGLVFAPDTHLIYFIRNGDIYSVPYAPEQLEKPSALEIYFDFDSYETREQNKLEEILSYAKDAKRIILIGHTDEKGSKKYNALLGMKRAKFVAKLLKNKGISKDKIIVLSQGETNPKYSDDARNRRVEVILKY